MVGAEVEDVGEDEEAGEAGMGEVGVVDMVVEGAGTAAVAAADGNVLCALCCCAIWTGELFCNPQR